MNPNHHKRDGINLNNPAISCCGVRQKKTSGFYNFFYDIVVACQFKFKLKVTINAAAFAIISGSLGSKWGITVKKKKKDAQEHDVTWQGECVWAHGPSGAVSEATIQPTRGSFFLQSACNPYKNSR